MEGYKQKTNIISGEAAEYGVRVFAFTESLIFFINTAVLVGILSNNIAKDSKDGASIAGLVLELIILISIGVLIYYTYNKFVASKNCWKDNSTCDKTYTKIA